MIEIVKIANTIPNAIGWTIVGVLAVACVVSLTALIVKIAKR
jgi:hypothetical protein